ncbi:uncharacterized protein STEHIDRAFT_85777 [Stereum hirsutum FP-91666 SS1]|uniref:uncharacterized protein n=1 Tax=Stereum hirsutum (strain FP-91666) TaxID=721885 RepID=UPI000444A0A0|nr:uncharacterized protein STEHIDRAFT_85777 [Stereum hirsutum FP-91666 SS1]EIM81452.1 hypothetical protein STEHIDRAFT_85777 [Stereum hirsutum FP-91666 SS1]
MSQPINPIHPSMIARLDAEYVAFHNANLLDVKPTHLLPWDPAIRNGPAVPGGSPSLEVAKIQDFELSKCPVRVFWPKGEKPEGGWSVFIFFHGGGWTLGNINSENSFSTHMAVNANCVVVSVDYRLAPENAYPAAVEDAVESLEWVRNQGPSLLKINPFKIAVGGSSSGGNLASILALKAATLTPPAPLVLQLLIVPVTDNTASTSDLWASNALTPWLSPGRMMWFRNNYLPNEADWTKWDASPIFAPKELLAKTPKAWIAVCECDILKEEGEKYGEKLKEAGVDVEVRVYEGAPHPIMAMDGALKIGAKMVAEAGVALAKAFAA